MDPNFYATHYRSGQEIRAGDRIVWGGKPGTVVFILGSTDIPEEWADSETWLGRANAKGFMLNTEAAGLIFEEESDENLTFVARQG